MKKVRIFDTTLRDGEQAPGFSMSHREKLEVAKQLEKLGVDIIEAGFAAASEGDMAAIKDIASAVTNSEVLSLARCVRKDIDAAVEAVASAARPAIHVFIATSDLHIEEKLHSTREDVLRSIEENVSYAKQFLKKVEFSAEDATRSDPAFLAKAYSAAIRAGATTINIPDTVGYTTPEEMKKLIRYLKENVEGIENVELSVHCHDDLGMAVANTMAAIECGIDQVECAVNGIGERAGNAALEEIAAQLYTRKDYYGRTTSLRMTELYKTSRMVAMVTGSAVQSNKAVVGKNAFLHESGIHQHGMLSNPLTYEIIRPETVGIKKGDDLVLGKHSGRHAFVSKLAELGYTELSEEAVNGLFAEFKELADKKKEVLDSDIEALLLKSDPNRESHYYKIENFVINSGNHFSSIASVALSRNGKVTENVSVGDGPVDAAFKAIDKTVGFHFVLDDFYISSVTGGRDALGSAKIRLRYGDKSSSATGISTDIIEACIFAYLKCINEMLDTL